MNGNKPNRKWQRQVDHPGPKWWHRHHRRWTYGMHAWSNRSASAVVEGFVWPNKTMCNEICEQFCTCCVGVPREREIEGVLSVWWFNDDISIFMVHSVVCLVSFWSQYFSLKCQHKKNTFVWYCCSPSAVGKWLLGVPWKWKNGHHIDVLVKVWLLSTFLRKSLSKHPEFFRNFAALGTNHWETSPLWKAKNSHGNQLLSRLRVEVWERCGGGNSINKHQMVRSYCWWFRNSAFIPRFWMYLIDDLRHDTATKENDGCCSNMSRTSYWANLCNLAPDKFIIIYIYIVAVA